MSEFGKTELMNFFEMLVKREAKTEKEKTGYVKAKLLQQAGEPLVAIKTIMTNQQIKNFSRLAKKYGLLFTSISDKNLEGQKEHIFFLKEKEISIAKNIINIMTQNTYLEAISDDEEVFAKCPWCDGNIYEDGKKVYCSLKCGFFIEKSNPTFVGRTKKNLTTINLQDLIAKGFCIETCSNKNHMNYKGRFNLIKSPKGYTILEFAFIQD